MKTIKSIAICLPLPDYGISTYCHELAQGLAQNGIAVTLLTSTDSKVAHLYTERRYRLLPVLNTFIIKRLITIRRKAAHANELASVHVNGPPQRVSSFRKSQWFLRIRDFMLAAELALFLKFRKYDLVWTHWHEFYGGWTWRMFRLLGLRFVHTVHNVLPHEKSQEGSAHSAAAYSLSNHLFTHSQFAANELARLFPKSTSKTSIQWHGLYTIVGNAGTTHRCELRKKLNITDGQVAVLCCGGIRPYKNVDATIQSLTRDDLDSLVVIIAGQESGFSDLVPGEPLGRLQRLAAKLGVEKKVRFLPGFLGTSEIEELFEASDILHLAYEYHSGSGLLLLGMTLGIHILATRTGGAEEYLENYPAATLIDDGSVAEVSRGLVRAAKQVRSQPRLCHFDEPRLQWSAIAGASLNELNAYIRA